MGNHSGSMHRPQPGSILRYREYVPRHDLLMYKFAESPSDPSLLCCLTDPLDMYISEDQLWDALKRWHATPAQDSPNLVRCWVKEEDMPIPPMPHTYRTEEELSPRTLKQILRRQEYLDLDNGINHNPAHKNVGIDYPFPCVICTREFDRHKLFEQKLTPQLLPQNPIRILRTWFDDKTKLMIRMCCGPDGKTQIRFREFVQFHSDPFVLEVWRIQKEGSRGANNHVSDSWEYVIDYAIEGEGGIPLEPPPAFEESHDFKHWVLFAEADEALW